MSDISPEAREAAEQEITSYRIFVQSDIDKATEPLRAENASLQAQVTELGKRIAELSEEREQAYAEIAEEAGQPVQHVRRMTLGQLVKTRFVSIEDHNQLAQKTDRLTEENANLRAVSFGTEMDEIHRLTRQVEELRRVLSASREISTHELLNLLPSTMDWIKQRNRVLKMTDPKP